MKFICVTAFHAPSVLEREKRSNNHKDRKEEKIEKRRYKSDEPFDRGYEPEPKKKSTQQFRLKEDSNPKCETKPVGNYKVIEDEAYDPEIEAEPTDNSKTKGIGKEPYDPEYETDPVHKTTKTSDVLINHAVCFISC